MGVPSSGRARAGGGKDGRWCVWTFVNQSIIVAALFVRWVGMKGGLYVVADSLRPRQYRVV